VLPDGERRVQFVGMPAAEAIARYGKLPLPPYIERDPTADDEDRYQTVYAEREGSVAAPTAGLHFTEAMLAEIRGRGVRIATLDLEVGRHLQAGGGGDRHASDAPERYEIRRPWPRRCGGARARGGGLGGGHHRGAGARGAAREDGTVVEGAGETRLLITPGYTFKLVDHLLTNFHLPRSTLLMLVAAFAGYDLTMAAYRHAVDERYRFYSYGDAMCIL
jgi:S-adenosylmethionine:tRNA ribosyltransferase-isomerase